MKALRREESAEPLFKSVHDFDVGPIVCRGTNAHFRIIFNRSELPLG